jgi:peptidyl-tRNA hydrolase ICT1
MSTDNLYPGSKSNDRFTAVDEAAAAAAEAAAAAGSNQQQLQLFNGHIPVKDLTVSYSRSSGPGGQNVNKTSTKVWLHEARSLPKPFILSTTFPLTLQVDVRFHFESASWLSAEAKERLRPVVEPQLTRDGLLVVKSDRTRSQLLNQADALRKLREFIW